MPEPTVAPAPGGRSPTTHVLLYLILAVPLSVLVFLAAAGGFEAWEGTAVCYLSDRRSTSSGAHSFLLVREGAPDRPVDLPTQAMNGRGLPACSAYFASATTPPGAARVAKHRFRLVLSVDDRAWPTARPEDLFLALGFLVLVFPLWNLAVVGAPFRLTRLLVPLPPIPVEEMELPGLRQNPTGQVVPPKDHGSIGPPPGGSRRRRHRG